MNHYLNQEEEEEDTHPLLSSEIKEELYIDETQDEHQYKEKVRQLKADQRDQLLQIETKERRLERAKIVAEKATKIVDNIDEQKQLSKDKAPYFQILFRYASRWDKLAIYFAYLCSFISGGLMPLQPIFVGLIIDEFSAVPPHTGKIFLYGVLMTIAALVILATVTIFYYILEKKSLKIIKKIKVEYLTSILKQEVQWFDQENAQELQTKMTQETQAMEMITGKMMGVNISILGTAICSIIFSFLVSWSLTLVVLLYFPLFFVIAGAVKIGAEKGQESNLKAYSQSAGLAEQALNAVKVVCAFGQENTEIKNYEQFLEQAYKTSYKSIHSISLGYSMTGFFMVFYLIYVYSAGGIFISKGKTNPNDGQLFQGSDVWMIQGVLSMGIFSFFAILPNLKIQSEGQVAGKLAFKVIDRQPEIKNSRDDAIKLSQNGFTGRIEFRNVDFKYQNTYVLKNFSAVFEEGKTTAIVGKSGSGKSTIISLIERFYDAEGGTILIDQANIKDLDLKDLRRITGYVGQEPVLFNSTIKENLLYANPNASDADIISALKQANVYDFIQKNLKHGIDTNVGHSGTQMSGGQKQRIAIARALLKKSKLLLLDEATSALDSKNEKEVQAALDNIKKELGSVTTVVVAHRLSTIRNADKIIVLDRGQIVEQGNHESLLSEFPEGIYSKMVFEQNKNTKKTNIDEASTERSFGKSTKSKSSYFSKDNEDLLRASRGESMYIQSYQQTTWEKSKRLISMSSKYLFIAALFFSLGFSMYFPVIGLLNTHMLFVLQGTYGYQMITQLIIYSLISFACLGLYVLLFCYIKVYCMTAIGVDITMVLRKQLYESILSKSMGWFDKREHSPGILTSAMSKDATIVNSMGSQTVSVFLDLVFSLAVGMIMALVFCWQIALVSILILPLFLVGMVMMIKDQKKVEIVKNTSQASANLLSGDVILNYRTVAGLANEEQIIKDYSRMVEEQINETGKHIFSVAFSFGMSKFGLMFTYSIILICSSYLLESADISPEKMFSAIMILVMTFIGISNSTYYIGEFSQANASADRIFGIIDEPSDINPLDYKQNPTLANQLTCNKTNGYKIQGNIEFKGVWFRYPSRKDTWVLRDFNLTIKPNQSLALVGESGCGKSTIVQLLLRFYDVERGDILIDGVNIQEYPLGDLRRQMGLVMQEPILFSYSIAENILYGKGLATNEEIMQASEKANIFEFIERFRDENDLTNIENSYSLLKEELENLKEEIIQSVGNQKFQAVIKEINILAEKEVKDKGKIDGLVTIDYREDTLKGDPLHPGFQKNCGLKGNRLSGGQKQRVAIARAIIRKPQILLLDEATSSLDEESQAIVQRAIDKLMGERTSIVIAHRLSTVEKCQRIVMIKNGQVVEDGSLEELKSDKDSYYNAFAMETVQAQN